MILLSFGVIVFIFLDFKLSAISSCQNMFIKSYKDEKLIFFFFL